MNPDNIIEYIACVNGGSGVIFQPANLGQTYILTAKHVLNNIQQEPYNGNIVIKYFSSASNTFIALAPFQCTDQNYFPHSEPDVDIAIIRIPRIEAPNNQIFLMAVEHDRKDFSLVGYPYIRREGQISRNWLRHDDELSIKNERNFKRREASLPHNPTYTELVGTSGAGIFKISTDYLLLAGVQNGMANGGEALGNIEYTPINYFNEIATEENGLEQILPCYMKSFSFLKDAAFELNLDVFQEQDAVYVQQCLRDKTQAVINTQVTPSVIKQFFEKRLLVDESNVDSLYKNSIWIAWLEFLTIMNIVKYENFDEEELKAIFNSTRLKYIDFDNDWTLLCKKELHGSDYYGLPINGTVFVSTPKAANGQTIIKPGQIPSIIRPYDKAKFKADSGIDPFMHYTFIHSSVLKRQYIIERLSTYRGIQDYETLLLTLKAQYSELFGDPQ